MFLSPNPAQANDTGEEGNTSAANLDVMSIDNMIPQPVSARNSTPNQSASFNIENETPDPRLSFNLSGLNRSNIRPHHQTPNVFFGERPTPITATSAMSSAPNCRYNRQERLHLSQVRQPYATRRTPRHRIRPSPNGAQTPGDHLTYRQRRSRHSSQLARIADKEPWSW